jgi:hypothetical protein
MDGVPRLERQPGVGLRVVAAAEGHAGAPLPGAIPVGEGSPEGGAERL